MFNITVFPFTVTASVGQVFVLSVQRDFLLRVGLLEMYKASDDKWSFERLGSYKDACRL